PPRGIAPAEPMGRATRLLRLKRERRGLGTRHAGEDIAGRHRVAEEQRVDGRYVHGDATGCVPWRVNDPRRAWDIEHVPVRDGRELRRWLDAQAAAAGGGPTQTGDWAGIVRPPPAGC